MKLTVKDVADLVGGTINGDPDCEISNVSKIHEAAKGDLTFLYLSSYEKYIDTTSASAVIVKKGQAKKRDDLTLIEVDKPELAFQIVIRKYFTYKLKINGIDPSASIDEGVVLGKNVSIGKNVVVSANCSVGDNSTIMHNTVLLDNVKIGASTLIYPNVTVRENCIIGNEVIIHSGTVIGSDGFGYAPRSEGGYDKIPQIGNVVLEDEVEIGSNVSIDRAAIGSTIIKKGTKIDNLVQIAHNVEVGENTAISAQAGIAGSTKLGKNCILAGQVGITGHIEITDGVIIGAQSGISKTITKPGKYFGYPAKELGQSLRLEGHFRNFPLYVERIKKLETEIDSLKKQLDKITEGDK
ncbi:MAG: UDP-3-O-(3-hydroxymyristoyl)glucosamine N-acyltransferase [Melioribacteraceae bacterium]|nr:UDP-3-O-(3-hydroxymyristoyl)glucosamine N-acyltransferase [Melioribacteraceae bacterium]